MSNGAWLKEKDAFAETNHVRLYEQPVTGWHVDFIGRRCRCVCYGVNPAGDKMIRILGSKWVKMTQAKTFFEKMFEAASIADERQTNGEAMVMQEGGEA